MMNSGEQDFFSKIGNPMMQPGLTPMGFGLPKPQFNCDIFSKFELYNNGANQNVSPPSGVPNLLKDKMNMMIFPPFFNPMKFQNLNLDDAEQASLMEKNNRGLMMGMPINPFLKPRTCIEIFFFYLDLNS